MTLVHSQTIGGKISIAAALLGVFVILLGLVIELPGGDVARANTATTSVTVLNTPPTWVEFAHEVASSSTSTPTNSGSTISWTAVADDSSGDNYYLIVCKTSAAPTPNPGGPPECNGGAVNRYARSGATGTNTPAVAATTTYDGDPQEFFDWWAWICDGTNPGASCNASSTQGLSNPGMWESRSPFVVNHRPTFTVIFNDTPRNPGELITWYATASDPDTYGGTATDTVRLFICRENDFTGTSCGPGGQWANSTTSYPGNGATTSDPVATTTLANPYPDAQYPGYAFVIDTHGNHAASGGVQGANRSVTVNNITPTVAAASVALLDTDGTGPLTLTQMATRTTGFRVEFTVSDQNSCQTASGTPEIVFGRTDVYRSGITQAGCNQSSQHNPNNCYPFGSATTSDNWTVSCVASSTAPCLGTGDSDIVWTCTFPLWYIAEATDGTGGATDPPHWAQNWLASVQTADNNFATSSLVEGTTGNELTSFLAYDTGTTTTIVYGGLQPGQSIDPIGPASSTQVILRAVGNVGLDETLYGTDMCPTYPTCSGNATSTIFVNEQRYATSSVAYAAATQLGYNPGVELEINVPKSTSTTTPASRMNFWGINVPAAITLSGDYIGVNTLIGIVGESAFW